MEAGDPPVDLGRLSKPEADAFRYIAEVLGARFEGDFRGSPGENAESASGEAANHLATPATEARALVAKRGSALAPSQEDPKVGPLLDRIPVSLLVVSEETVVFMNRTALSQFGYASTAVVDAVGGFGALFDGGRHESGLMVMRTASGARFLARVTMVPVDWAGGQEMLVTALPATVGSHGGPASTGNALQALLDANPDPVAVVSRAGLVEACNRSFRSLPGGDGAVLRLHDRLSEDDTRHVVDLVDVAFGIAGGIARSEQAVDVDGVEHAISVGALPGGKLACVVLHTDGDGWPDLSQEPLPPLAMEGTNTVRGLGHSGLPALSSPSALAGAEAASVGAPARDHAAPFSPAGTEYGPTSPTENEAWAASTSQVVDEHGKSAGKDAPTNMSDGNQPPTSSPTRPDSAAAAGAPSAPAENAEESGAGAAEGEPFDRAGEASPTAGGPGDAEIAAETPDSGVETDEGSALLSPEILPHVASGGFDQWDDVLVAGPQPDLIGRGTVGDTAPKPSPSASREEETGTAADSAPHPQKAAGPEEQRAGSSEEAPASKEDTGADEGTSDASDAVGGGGEAGNLPAERREESRDDRSAAEDSETATHGGSPAAPRNGPHESREDQDPNRAGKAGAALEHSQDAAAQPPAARWGRREEPRRADAGAARQPEDGASGRAVKSSIESEAAGRWPGPPRQASALEEAVREVRQLVANAAVLIITEGDDGPDEVDSAAEAELLRLLLLSIAARAAAGSVMVVRRESARYVVELSGDAVGPFEAALSSDRVAALARAAGASLRLSEQNRLVVDRRPTKLPDNVIRLDEREATARSDYSS